MNLVLLQHNAQRIGLYAGLEFLNSSPELLPNKITKVEVNNKKYSNERQAGTKVQ
ncbi:MAG: hypothetical protein JSR12_09025 [Bacteroidetes bacterium]|nr:hypothetical protein [Bacteroidota bacterium]